MEFIAGHRVAPPPFINPQKKSIFFATFPNMFLLLSVLEIVFLSWTILDTDLHDVLVWEHGGALGGGEAEVGQAHGGGQREGDREPDQAPRDETPHSLTEEGIKIFKGIKPFPEKRQKTEGRYFSVNFGTIGSNMTIRAFEILSECLTHYIVTSQRKGYGTTNAQWEK